MTVPVQPKQIRSVNARFTGSAAVPVITLLGTSSATFSVTPVVSGDSLAAGEPIDAYATVDLPNGVLLGQARAVGLNQVKLTFSAVVALSIASAAITWTIVAHR